MARTISVEILGDARSLEKAFAKSSKSAKRFQGDITKTGKQSRKVFGGLGKVVGLATGALGAAGLAGAARAAFTEMAEAQKVAAQTTAVLKSTGGAANVSAKQIDELAGSLMRKSGVDDEAIKSGENLLLTFTNIRNETGKGNDVFNQATKTILDMSVALGQDMKTSAIQLGKALQDPVKGIGALRRVGVQFTADQEKQIKALAKTGHTLQAQKLILAELNREFGGSAEAAGNTLPGKLNILRESLLNLGGTIAEKLSPQITAVVDRMVKWISNTKNQETVVNAFKTAAAVLAGALKTLKTVFDALSFAVGGNKNAIKVLIAVYAGWKIAGIISSVTKLAGSFGLLTTRTKGATVATRGMQTSLVGKAGLVGAVGLLSFGLTTAILKLTGLDKKLRAAGGAAFDLAERLGIVGGAGKQFEGKTVLGQQASGFVRKRAARLQAQGMTPAQSARRILQTHPDLAPRDVGVLAGVGTGGVTIHQHFNAPTTDRHREARYARNATRAVFDG